MRIFRLAITAAGACDRPHPDDRTVGDGRLTLA